MIREMLNAPNLFNCFPKFVEYSLMSMSALDIIIHWTFKRFFGSVTAVTIFNSVFKEVLN